MALTIDKCKSCGAPLDINSAVDGVVRCAYCRNTYTVVKRELDPAALSFIRQGEHDLDTCKFDDAYKAFSKASQIDASEPEAFFGMALAEFKVQYLKDIPNQRLQPICHEITDKVFSDNKNYKRALELATDRQRIEYERKAEDIDNIRKEFFKLEQSGKDYDCFICVKVTDDNTKMRTADYKDADDIYFELKGKGYKPFFSERELRNESGADYEARILYALYCSECMLVVCSNEEYLRTPWVENEYKRFLKLINDEEKESDSITIVYGGKPIEKLSGKNGKIQGIDINSLNAMERIVNFVESHSPEGKKRREQEKLKKQRELEEERKQRKQAEEEYRQRLQQIEEENKKRQRELEEELNKIKASAASRSVAPVSGDNLAAVELYLLRAGNFLSSGDYESASSYYQRAVEAVPESGEGWWGLFLCENKVAAVESLLSKVNLNYVNYLNGNENYNNAVKYSDNLLYPKIKKLQDRVKAVVEEERRKEQERIAREEAARKKEEQETKAFFEEGLIAFNSNDLYNALQLFGIAQKRGYIDNENYLLKTQNKINEIKAKAEAERRAREEQEAKNLFDDGLVAFRNSDFQDALKLFNLAQKKGYADKENYLLKTKNKIDEIKAKAEAERRAREEQEAKNLFNDGLIAFRNNDFQDALNLFNLAQKKGYADKENYLLKTKNKLTEECFKKGVEYYDLFINNFYNLEYYKKALSLFKEAQELGNNEAANYIQKLSESLSFENTGFRINGNALNSFDRNRKQKVVVIPYGIKEISAEAFRFCKKIRKVYIPKTVQYVGVHAFDCCKHLTIYCEGEKTFGWGREWAVKNSFYSFTKCHKIIWNYKRKQK